jgi:hypothetical protein
MTLLQSRSKPSLFLVTSVPVQTRNIRCSEGPGVLLLPPAAYKTPKDSVHLSVPYSDSNIALGTAVTSPLYIS